MPVIEDQLIIRESPERIFDLAQDYRSRLEWDPFLRELRFLDGATTAAVGVRVWVRAWTGLTMTVEYISVNRPKVVAMKMLLGPFFLRSFSGTWRFRPHDQHGTEVLFRYAFEVRWAWSRWALNPIIAAVFRRDIASRLRGLRHGVEQLRLGDRPSPRVDSSQP